MTVGVGINEAALIWRLQEGLPLAKRPFSVLAEYSGINEASLLEIIKRLKENRIIRQISPIYDTRRLGYESLLVAFKVDPLKIERAVMIINGHPGVSHNYERDHAFNLWFTLAIPPDSRFGAEKTVDLLASLTDTKEYAILRAKRIFKIGLKLDMEGNGTRTEEEISSSKILSKTRDILTEEEKRIIRVTQEDMPLIESPFLFYASILGLKEEYLLEKLREFKRKGIMRRFAAVLYHRNAGFSANGMVVWKVPEGSVEKVGQKIASYKAVSHCYERATNGVWQYNLFSMLHAKRKEDIEEIVREISSDTGIRDFVILYSTKEFKKKRVKYFTEDFYRWEESQGE